jgi:hypothetical protein
MDRGLEVSRVASCLFPQRVSSLQADFAFAFASLVILCALVIIAQFYVAVWPIGGMVRSYARFFFRSSLRRL